MSAVETPDWVTHTPDDVRYELGMTDTHEYLQDIRLSRDEFISLKARLAELRGLSNPEPLGEQVDPAANLKRLSLTELRKAFKDQCGLDPARGGAEFTDFMAAALNTEDMSPTLGAELMACERLLRADAGSGTPISSFLSGLLLRCLYKQPTIDTMRDLMDECAEDFDALIENTRQAIADYPELLLPGKENNQ